MKKSNNLGGLTGPRKSYSPHWQGLAHSQSQEYQRIKGQAVRLVKGQSRAIAIEFIQRQRPWLAEYFRPAGVPASGWLLDSWLKS
jgi:hypothetical protein